MAGAALHQAAGGGIGGNISAAQLAAHQVLCAERQAHIGVFLLGAGFVGLGFLQLEGEYLLAQVIAATVDFVLHEHAGQAAAGGFDMDADEFVLNNHKIAE